MSDFKVGYASVNINPELGIGIFGYYVPRFAEGILDDITANALALECNGRRLFMISVDTCTIPSSILAKMAERVEEKTGIPAENVYICATHTHTAPLLFQTAMFDADMEPVMKYREFLIEKVAEVCVLALADLAPARMGYAVGRGPDRIAYVRRYKMKDGSTMTCPPINDPNIDHALGELDMRVNVLRFDREGKESIVVLNFGLHADTVNGSLISADWPGWARKTLRDALGVNTIVFAGAEGDVGSTNVHPGPGDMNDTEISFDNEMKSPGMARFVGRALAGTVLTVYDKVAYTDVDDIAIFRKSIQVPSNRPNPEDMPRAKEYKRLHDSGRDDLIPYTAMELTTVVAEAVRMCRLENGPDLFTLNLTGLKIGNVAFVGIPGEPFTDIGVEIKKKEGWDLIFPTALTGGDGGYYPMRSAYDEGGYEARSSVYKAGVAELIIEGAHALLDDMKK